LVLSGQFGSSEMWGSASDGTKQQRTTSTLSALRIGSLSSAAGSLVISCVGCVSLRKSRRWPPIGRGREPVRLTDSSTFHHHIAKEPCKRKLRKRSCDNRQRQQTPKSALSLACIFDCIFDCIFENSSSKSIRMIATRATVR
jgi:hypothetical protein